jgi:hypothetical protein
MKASAVRVSLQCLGVHSKFIGLGHFDRVKNTERET